MRARKNELTTSIKNMIKKARKNNKKAAFEFGLCYNSNTRTQHVYDAWEIRQMYPRDYDEYSSAYVHCGYSKKTFCCIPDQDKKVAIGDVDRYVESEYIVVKRMNMPARSWWTGKLEEKLVDGKNQLVEEIRTWEYFCEREESDYLCPILRWGFQQGDKVTPADHAVCDSVYIIAYKASFVGNLKKACRWAEDMNNDKGYFGETAEERFEKIEAFSEHMGWWDATDNSGNSGVIFDPVKNCYKAVIIDYAL